MKTLEAIKQALGLLHRNTGINLTVLRTEATMGDRKVDALITFKDKPGRRFAVEYKRTLQKETLGPIVHYLKQLPIKGMVIAEYINPAIAEQLKTQNIPFLDLAGNAYLNEPPVFVYIKGERNKDKIFEREPRGAAYQPTGLKILFAFICKPALIQAPFREIAEQADVALGTVGWFMRDLKALGFLTTIGKGKRRLVERERLIKEWAMHYPTALRPKLLLGKYTARDANWWQKAKVNPEQTFWGGEVAAAKVTKYLRPAVFTLYTMGNAAELVVLNNLRENTQGEVELLRAFWKPGLVTGRPVVPPLLIYADLLFRGDKRNLETANIIYERHLMGFIEAD